MFEQCRNYVLKPTVQEPMKPWKGSRFNHANSDQIRWLPMTSIDAPQISGRIHPLLTQLPRDAPPTRPSFHCRQSLCRRGKELRWSGWCTGHRPRPGRYGKQSVKRMTRGKTETTDYCFRRHFTHTESKKTELKSRSICFLGPKEFKLKKN